ncbi:tight adherence protein C [Sporobacter termitidis DSM 10068]|uniref:Tight adherence protein C n=1 Tax=Sporobacter termitidis DSM 10068 TaxID=1123282 RepID=A0A1M5Z413_9FIRM|nr:type II secretion system F family protein [Sporobacter termitidis]SHI18949.1 tight adherence protein C [Sporobacter termitidis DSM 10068]
MKYISALLFGVFFGCIVYMGLDLLYRKRIIINKRLRMAMNQSDSDEADANASFSARILKPLSNRLLGFFAMFVPLSATAQEKLTAQLMQAEIRMSAKNYSAAVLLLSIVCAGAGVLVGQLLGKPPLTSALFGAVGIYAGVALSRFQLKGKISRRKDEIYHQMPDALDLLSVSVAAGLGFDQALSYVVRKSEGALIREFDTVQREISLGRSRKEAMERLAERCGSIEIQTFVSAILQADEMGASIKNVLQIQAATIRETHKQNVEEKMQKLSVKMLIPMVLFIFPVLLIVLLGPAVPSIIQALGSMG